jgi:serine protease Do
LARQIAKAQIEQALSAVPVQVTAALAQVTTRAVQEAVAAKLQVRLADALAQQATAAPRPRVTIDASIEETGWLGVSPEEVSTDRAKDLKLSPARGVYLEEVEKDSPAEKAGLKSGDVILEFNGQRVEGVVQFRRLVRETPPGHTVALSVWRDGHAQTLNVTLATVNEQFGRQFNLNLNSPNFAFNMPEMNMTPMPAMPAMPEVAPFPQGSFSFRTPGGQPGGVFIIGNTPTIGISSQNLSGQLGSYFGAPDGEGVLIENVQSDSPAEKAGLKAGDVITKLDGNRVKTIGELQSQLREKREDKTVQLTIVRKGSEMTISVEPNKPKATAPAKVRGTAL